MNIDFTNNYDWPGIQSYGCLIGVCAKSGTIEFYSENIQQFFKSYSKPILGTPISDFFDFEINFDDVSKLKQGNYIRKEVIIDDIVYILSIHTYQQIIYLEFEEVEESEDFLFDQISFIDAGTAITEARSESECINSLISSIKNIIAYDRVIIYEFNPDESNGGGIVTFEICKEGIFSYLGSQFSLLANQEEITAVQCNKSKYFKDVYSEGIKLVKPKDKIYNLIYCFTCNFSDNYLNMIKSGRIESFFILPMLIDGKDKSVICHNETVKHIPLFKRLQCEHLVSLAKLTNLKFQSEIYSKSQIDYKDFKSQIKENLLINPNFLGVIQNNLPELCDLTNSDGIAILGEENYFSYGTVAPLMEIQKIKKWAFEDLDTPIYSSNSFKMDYDDKFNLTDESTGVMFSFLNDSKSIFIIWFRKGEEKLVNFHNQTNIYDTGSVKTINYREHKITGKSKKWEDSEIIYGREIISLIKETLKMQSNIIQSLYEELEDVNKEMDVFSSTISHDLKTPLSVMKLNLQMLQRSLGDDENKTTRVKSVIDEVDNLSDLMQNVLKLTKTKKADLNLCEVEMDSLLDKVIEECRIYNTSTNLNFRIKDIFNIKGDKTLIYEVFLNLISNAVKYSSKNENPLIEISSQEKGDFVEYFISDNGIGILKEDFPKMFKLFSRMSNSRDFTGTGVGLSIVHKIMEKLDGKITFESTENVGTKFKLVFQKC